MQRRALRLRPLRRLPGPPADADRRRVRHACESCATDGPARRRRTGPTTRACAEPRGARKRRRTRSRRDPDFPGCRPGCPPAGGGLRRGDRSSSRPAEQAEPAARRSRPRRARPLRLLHERRHGDRRGVERGPRRVAGDDRRHRARAGGRRRTLGLRGGDARGGPATSIRQPSRARRPRRRTERATPRRPSPARTGRSSSPTRSPSCSPTSAFTSLNALALLEGRSYLSGRLGEQLFHPSFTVSRRRASTRGLPKAFDFEGVPKQLVTLVEEGVARDVVWDRRTAKPARKRAPSTGHGLRRPRRRWARSPPTCPSRPGDATPEELAELVGDGIYVTRLHYLSSSTRARGSSPE